MKHLIALASCALALPASAQEWIGHGAPQLGGAQWAMTSWDPDGPGPLPSCITIGGPCSDPSATASSLSYWDGRGWRGMSISTPGLFGLTTHNGELYLGSAGNQTWGSGPTAFSANIARFDRTRFWNVHNPLATSSDFFHGLASFNGQLFANTGSGVTAWDGTSWAAHSTVGAWPESLCTHNGQLIAATDSGVRVFNGTTWQLWPGEVAPFAPLEAVESVNGHLYKAPAGSGSPVQRWTGSAWEALPYPPSLAGSTRALAAQNGELWALRWNDASCPVVRFDGTEWREPGPGLNGPVTAVVAWRGRLAIAGSFTRGSYRDINSVALMDGDQFSSVGATFGARVLCVHNDELIAGGAFTSFAGQQASRIAAYDGMAWRALGGGLPDAPESMASQGGRLFACRLGFSPTWGYLLSWDGQTWSPETGPFGESERSIRVYQSSGRLFLLTSAGVYERVNGVWTRLNGLGTGILSSASSSSTMLLSNGSLYLNGVVNVDGQLATLARWTGTGWERLPTTVTSTGVFERSGELHAITTVSGIRRIARWTGSAWVNLTPEIFFATAPASVIALPFNSDVLVFGNFLHVSSSMTSRVFEPISYFARWRDRPICLTDFNGDGDHGTDQDIEAFFACLAGACCPTCPPDGDFNGDGDVGTDQDIESFFRVLAGGTC